MNDGRIDVPVLIVGAGTSGLCASILLSGHGVESLTVERHPGTSIYPRATGINVRSMEIFRSLGLQGAISRASFEVEPRIAFSRVLIDPQPRVSPSFHPDGRDVSPADWTSCSQKELEPILLREAISHPQAQVLFGTELLGFEQSGEGVIAQIGDRATGQVCEVRCRYLVAADGSKSPVRQRLGIGMSGAGVLGHTISIHFSAALKHYLPRTPNFLQFVQNEDVMGIFIATNGESRWVFAVPDDPDQGQSSGSFTLERAVELVRKGAGLPDLDVEVVGIVPWTMQADSAQRWRVENVFLAGDAAHRMTPAGGLGLNTGIQDVHNLCWKLAAVVQGWAGPDLLDTYETERRPVAEHNVDRSVAIITGDSGYGRTGLDVDLGFTYASPAVLPDGSELPHRADGDYEPVARPGSRAPHVWIDRGRDPVSTLDLFGPHFTLLTGLRGERWSRAADEVADDLGLPMVSHSNGGIWTSAYDVEETGAVLVRPDGHVAWRQPAAVPFPAMELRSVTSAVLSRPEATFRSLFDDVEANAG
jgi:putative polyketide hydroxylase